jgi:hypothetical protein
MSEAAAERVRRREIRAADLPVVAELLDVGFPDRGLGYWLNALEALQARSAPAGYPQFGYLLEGESAIVGVILLIFTAVGHAGDQIRCNVSSWYVDPAYRLHASPLISGALRFKGVTYLNVSPAPHTWPILEAQGYQRYTAGQFASLPVLSLAGLGARVRLYNPAEDDAVLPAGEAALLRDHRSRGLLVLVCARGDELSPMVFLPRDVRPVGPVVMQLAYCRDTGDFVRNAGAIGRFLARRGVAIVLCDGEGPIRGLVGRFFKDRSPKYFKGADRPRLNDLAYTEAVLFGA